MTAPVDEARVARLGAEFERQLDRRLQRQLHEVEMRLIRLETTLNRALTDLSVKLTRGLSDLELRLSIATMTAGLVLVVILEVVIIRGLRK